MSKLFRIHKLKYLLIDSLIHFHNYLVGTHPRTRIIHPQYLVNENLRSLVEKIVFFYFKATENQSILDVGCGLKPYQYTLPNTSWFGIDISGGPQVDLIIDDTNTWNLPSNEFSAVICTEVLEHTKDPTLVLSEIFRVMKPGAVALITTPFVYGIHGAPNDYRRYTNYGLINSCAAFEVIDSGLLGGIGSTTVININNWISKNISKSFFLKFSLMPIFFVHCAIFNFLGKGFDWFDNTGDYGTNSWVLLKKS